MKETGGIRRIGTGSNFSVVRGENEKDKRTKKAIDCMGFNKVRSENGKDWRIRIDTGRISAWFTVRVKETRGP